MSNYTKLSTDLSTQELVENIVNGNIKTPIVATLESDGKGNVNLTSLEKNHKKKEHMMLGFGIYYKDSLRWILEDIINNSKAKILSYIIKYSTKDGYINLGSIKKISNETGVHRTQIKKILNELEKEEVIANINDNWYYNPFILNVPTNSFTEIAKLQSRWTEIHEAYIQDPKTGKWICKYRPEKE